MAKDRPPPSWEVYLSIGTGFATAVAADLFWMDLVMHGKPPNFSIPSAGSGPLGTGSRRLVPGQIEDLKQGPSHSGHLVPSHLSERPLDESTVVNGTHLVDQRVRIALQISCGGDSDPERLGIRYHARREWGHKGRRMSGVEQRLRLDNQYGTGLSRLGSPSRIQIRNPHLTALNHRRSLQGRRIRR
ncbi:MAG: hypothetical protein OXC19_17240 [Bryobacterales bacterium]|nr:hypothetical protein [Bryobacterales bacterium]